MIGEPKHGLWRGQESGFIREYRKAAKAGLKDGFDPNDWGSLSNHSRYALGRRNTYGGIIFIVYTSMVCVDDVCIRQKLIVAIAR